MLFYYSNKTDFLVANCKPKGSLLSDLTSGEYASYLFGYCLDTKTYKRNEKLTTSEFSNVKNNNVDFSGVYAAIELQNGRFTIAIDPLCQFNIFYYSDGENFAMSSSVSILKSYMDLKGVSDEYLYDQLAYQSPMRGLTILDAVYYVQYDDIASLQPPRESLVHIKSTCLIDFIKPNYEKYSFLSYEELLQLYIERLNSKANLVASIFDKVHVQLTGGADSRLALSSFKDSDRVECYVYGNGNSQNRLIFEEILAAKAIPSVPAIQFIGQPLTSPSRIFKGLLDSNFLKSNNLNTYMNGPIDSEVKSCKITGYYGANVCGGVVLPPDNTSENVRINKIPSNLFQYKSYVKSFAERYSGQRQAAFNDKFYINNRGKGHYSSHSIADNKHAPSIDILYDYINLILVEKCPYSDWHIDKNAISIDLIYANDPQLAMFPYDDRKVPKYRAFDNIPLINCFSGYSFSSKELNDFKVIKPSVNFECFDFLKQGNSFMSIKDMFQIPQIYKLALEYPECHYLTEQTDIQANIFLYFLLGKFYLQQ